MYSVSGQLVGTVSNLHSLEAFEAVSLTVKVLHPSGVQACLICLPIQIHIYIREENVGRKSIGLTHRLQEKGHGRIRNVGRGGLG